MSSEIIKDMSSTLDKLNQLVSEAQSDRESLMLAAGMLTLSKQIFEYYLGPEQADEMLMSQTGSSNESSQYQIH